MNSFGEVPVGGPSGVVAMDFSLWVHPLGVNPIGGPRGRPYGAIPMSESLRPLWVDPYGVAPMEWPRWVNPSRVIPMGWSRGRVATVWSLWLDSFGLIPLG